MSDTFKILEKNLGEGRVVKNFTISPYTTFKMGGPAKFYFKASSRDDLINAAKGARELNLKFIVLGAASNVVISDAGFDGLVIKNMFMQKEVVEDKKDGVLLKVSSGYVIGRLVKETVDMGLSGFEYHLGLPGTLGGAIYMNSKWTKPDSYVGDNLVLAEIIDKNGQLKIVDKKYFDFAYDKSVLQETKETLISATFFLKKEDKQILEKRAADSLKYRKETQPFGVASSGCFFRNVNGQSAGKIIDELKLKGLAVGDLYVSDKHANFIINKGKGTAADFHQLVEKIKKEAKLKLGVDLKEEVVYVE